MNINTIIKIKSECLLDGCSGMLVEIRKDKNPLWDTYIVKMPNDKRLAFSKHEVEKYNR